MNAWAFVAELKPGDLVIVESPGFPKRRSVERVEKRTKLYVIVGGKKFRLNGFEAGDRYRRAFLRQATLEAIESVLNAVKVERYRIAFHALFRAAGAVRAGVRRRAACGRPAAG